MWKKYALELTQVSEIKVSRCLSVSEAGVCDLHGFCDASEKGYGAVIYCRSVDNVGRVTVSLLIAKSKVAPLKRISLPRLELCGAELLSRLMHFVIEVFSETLSFSSVTAWSDSQVALSWIKSSPHRWKTFVSNRVTGIQSRISPKHWRHIRSALNPADCASRGLLPVDLLKHELWWKGPSFLWQSQPISLDESHQNKLSELEDVICVEQRKIVLLAMETFDPFDDLLKRFSSMWKIQRCVAYCFRFCFYRKDRIVGPFGAAELHRSLMALVGYVQRISFSVDMLKIKNGERCSKVLRRLNPFLDEKGVLRVGGRLVHSRLCFDKRFPAVLPRNHRLTELIITQVHKDNLHPGLQTTHFLLSQQFWILSPRRTIRSCLSKCIECFRLNPIPCQPKMGNLPEVRVSQLKPFACVGEDFGGPFLVTLGKHRGVKSQKAYICLFVCMATKAIHIELVSDLSSEAFIAALRRLIARRGRCSKLFSDQGTNFVGAWKILKDYMLDAACVEKIEWSFNPPSAPHFGGIWEAGIKSVKSHLLRVIGEQVLTYEELYTVLVQIEALLNSRPLYAVSSDPNDLSVLTPGHFLTLEPLTSAPDSDLSHLKLGHLNRWQLIQRMQQDFWKRWREEYLHTLHQRYKWDWDSPTPIRIGTLVLIKNELLPPLRWKIGRIVTLSAGSDCVCRVATVHTTTGVLQRPLVKLCPLPCQ